MQQLLKNIITNKTHCYFLSPSFGDVASSTGEVLAYLAGKVDITVINIFTQAGEGKITFSAKKFLKHSKASNATVLYESRTQEDAFALSLFPVTVHNIQLADALWRKKKKKTFLTNYLPELEHLYPTYKHIMSGKIAKEDIKIEHDLEKKITDLIQTQDDNFLLFCPIGFFTHVDYLLIRNFCWKKFKKNCIFYSLPINDLQDKEKNTFIQKNKLEQLIFTQSSEKKHTVLKAYTSQFDQFALALQPEIYYRASTSKQKIHTVTLHKTLTENVITDWQTLWNTSGLKNFFNAPLWFQATMQTYTYPEILIVTCYEDETLVGILPVVLTKKYGIPTYVTPGDKYYDNSSLLLATNDPQIVQSLIKKLAEAGNFYLGEIAQPVANICSIFMKDIGIIPSSKSPYFSLQENMYRFISKKNKRILAKKFKDAGEKISFHLYQKNIEEHIPALLEIDDISPKKETLKATFADPYLATLLKNLSKLQSETVTVALLFYENTPIAYNYGLVYKDTFMGTGTAFDKKWSSLSPGRLLVYSLLPKLVEIGVHNFDFSRGISRFKTDFTPYYYQQYAIFASSNTSTRLLWKTLAEVKNYLEKRPALFEFVRRIKKMIGK